MMIISNLAKAASDTNQIAERLLVCTPIYIHIYKT